MSSNRNSSTGSGLSLGGVLLVIFITLKLAKVIHWSWWWVLSPLWLGAALVVAVLLVMLVIAGIAMAVKGRKPRPQVRRY